MLRIESKNKFIQILKDIDLLCSKGLQKWDALSVSILQECQEAVIAVGECVEKEIAESGEIISLMESLCESFYLQAQNLDKGEIYMNQIHVLLDQILSLVIHIPACYQVLFFPYKADMWDSLESIWLACKDDPLCDCKVVPIPYYHFDAAKNEWLYCYEIDRFPSYVPVVDYREYSLEERADAAFVHNPYDQYNYVTHVHSDYYSYNLKKYVQNLFYVPYYVTSGFIAEDHKVLSVYPNADYLVVQSDSFKEGMKQYTYHKKAIVMGSPKLDRVIRLSGQKEIVPEEWKEILAGKKSLMLNTSLSQFLYDGEAYLQKIAYLFDVIKKRDDVVIIWRPHPLLQSTIESMRPHLLTTYEQLQQFFVNEKVGILDKTPDILNTVAIADGYIGESASSVINLFEAAGKPLFILNNYISDRFSSGELQRLHLADCEKVGNSYYCVSTESSSVYEVKEADWSNVSRLAGIENVPKWMMASARTAWIKDTIYLLPVWSEEFYAYDMNANSVEAISSVQEKKILNYRYIVEYKDKVFYLPNITKCIAEYDTIHNIWKKYTEPIKALQKDIAERIFEDVCGYFVNGRDIWMTTLYSNRVLWFDMETGSYQIYEFGDSAARYSAIAVVDSVLYLSGASTGILYVWDLKVKRQRSAITMPKGYQAFLNVQGRGIAHNRLVITKDSLIAVPGTANGLVKIDLKTEKVTLLAEEFWSDVLEPANGYKPQAHGVITLVKMVDEDTLLIQKRRDASLLELNVHTGEYKIHHPKLAPGELDKMLEGEDGFEKSYTNGEFARRESRYFSFEGFLDDLVNDRLENAMERQKKAMETMAVNLDGTCGEKVHEFMMNVLTKE